MSYNSSFESVIINFTQPFRTESFYKGKTILMIEVQYLSNAIKWSITDILEWVGINKLGFNQSTPLKSNDKMYLGTLLVDDKCYITLAVEDSAINDEVEFEWIEV